MVAANSISVAGNYTVHLRLYSTEFPSVLIYNTSVSVTMVAPPLGGQLTINRETGTALYYEYTVRAVDWRGATE